MEDSPGDIRPMQEAFKEGNLSIARDGVQAMTFLRRGEYAESPRPAIILLDLHLPRKDGREVMADLTTLVALSKLIDPAKDGGAGGLAHEMDATMAR